MSGFRLVMVLRLLVKEAGGDKTLVKPATRSCESVTVPVQLQHDECDFLSPRHSKRHPFGPSLLGGILCGLWDVRTLWACTMNPKSLVLRLMPSALSHVT
ncbi:hypothetical protein GUJ93_ZPchr0013g35089 [Zizania palustris]|uniref:Secreted protein n=1 Tax=Zizania palustris TaxID=103762 RepID=A0A8J6C1V4_ZIZPA|nr:hypothetical protein GUJ93_ZPchr0013g35089 [Zizania palustris]